MIEAKTISMYYGPFKALDNVSFVARKGEILGLLGPNGAGKTTIMRILSSYLYPTSGTALIGGHDITKNPLATRRLIGYMPETAPLYFDMVVRDYLIFVGRARGLSGAELTKRLTWVRDETDIKPIWRHTLSEISKGYRQRVGLAQALIHDPEVLILDEVTSGLDPLQIIGIRDLIKELSEHKTIIFSTHILQEVEAITHRIVILNEGRVIADGTREELVETATKGHHYMVTVKAERGAAEPAMRALTAADEVRFEGQGNGYVTFTVRAGAGRPIVEELNDVVRRNNWEVKKLVSKESSLEEAFIWFLNRGKERPAPKSVLAAEATAKEVGT